MANDKKQWRPIKGYENIYEVSNFGEVRSLDRFIKYFSHSKDKTNFIKGKKIKRRLKPPCEYFYITLAKGGKCEFKSLHILVWDTFGDKLRNGRVLMVDHIDNDKTNNRIDNLQLLTTRENTSKYQRLRETSSEYIGVSLDKNTGKWRPSIHIDGRTKHLGSFISEYKAHLVYCEALGRVGDNV